MELPGSIVDRCGVPAGNVVASGAGSGPAKVPSVGTVALEPSARVGCPIQGWLCGGDAMAHDGVLPETLVLLVEA